MLCILCTGSVSSFNLSVVVQPARSVLYISKSLITSWRNVTRLLTPQFFTCCCCCMPDAFFLNFYCVSFYIFVSYMCICAGFLIVLVLCSQHVNNLTFMDPCIANVFSSITNNMQRYKMHLFLWNSLHVSGGSSAHHQELKTVYTASGTCQASSATYRYRGRAGVPALPR
jgi:hypothetical protein